MPFTSLTQAAAAIATTPNDPFEGLTLHRTKGYLKAVYDFAVQGGAVSTISLLDDLGNPATLPAGAVVTKATIDHKTACTSGGSATVAAQIKTAGDLLAATAVASMTGFVDGVADGTAAHMVKLTADSQVKIVIAVAALTAGKFAIHIEFVNGAV